MCTLKMVNPVSLVGLILVASLGGSIATANVYLVRPDGTGDYPTIQAAVNAAASGDIIELADGVFTGNGNRDLDFAGKAITVRSQSGDPAVCIIDCQGSQTDQHRGFHFHSGEGPDSVLTGVTITNGHLGQGYPGDVGAGVYCEWASPTITHCVFRSNRAVGGAGLASYESASTVVDCVFDSNSSVPGIGGGVACITAEDAKFVNCTFLNNGASGSGGGLSANDGGVVTVSNCMFSGNWSNQYGGGMELCSFVATVSGCTFEDNLVLADSGGGGGVACTWTVDPVTLTNCTFSGNWAPFGAGVYCAETVSLVVEQTIIAFGTPGEAVYCVPGAGATLTCCDVYGNGGGDWVGCLAGQNGVRGNIALDPLFCADGDLRLHPNSPCAPDYNPACGLIGAWPVGCGPVSVWYFDDAGVAGWGQTYNPPKWEWMDAGPLPDCTMQDLDPSNPYYAASYPISADYSGYRFYAEIWLANNYANYVEPVTVELRRGSWGDEGTLIASATAYVTEPMNVNFPGWPHIFDFGTICDLVLNDESLVLKIIYNNPQGGQTHIYWNGEYCASALHALSPNAPPGLDTVVCEPRGGANPSHPSTYWYDVTPGDAYGRCDFHVRVYDPNPANYTYPTKPATTWQFAVHQVGSEWWASWWDPNCVNPITGPFRFQFTNSSPRTWGDWRVTIGASSNPHVWVSDFNGTHLMQPDGYGLRVHVPATAASDNFVIASQPNLVGVWKSDSAWGDFDGDADLDLVIAGVTAAGTRVTKTYENLCGTLILRQDLAGVESESSGNLAWGDYDGDGDLDLVIAGTSDSGPIARIYENDGAGNLTWDSAQVLTGVHYASVAWGDYDLDGDLDLFIQGYDGTQNRAILYRNHPLGTLTPDTSQSFTGLRCGSADWGDYDGDGDPDLITTGGDGTNCRTILYKNHPVGTLTDDGSHGLPGVALSDTAWGDMDGDGDLDLAITGEDGTNRHAHVYRNDGAGNLTQVGGDLMTIYRSSCAWGDFDNDGDLDVAFCGYDGYDLYTYVFRNTGSGFTAVFAPVGVREGALNWVDVDGDGKLDLFLTGADWNYKYARVYQKTGGVPNTAPTPPSTLGSDLCDGLNLSWSGMTDPETGSPGLYYAVRVGTTPGGQEVMSGTYGTPLMGNCGPGTVLWLDVPPGTYYWSVRTIDSGLAASPWAPEQISQVSATYQRGDLNCDGTVGFGDINPFVLFLSDFAGWQLAFVGCDPRNGDINCDGVYPSFGDINPFVALLSGP